MTIHIGDLVEQGVTELCKDTGPTTCELHVSTNRQEDVKEKPRYVSKYNRGGLAGIRVGAKEVIIG